MYLQKLLMYRAWWETINLKKMSTSTYIVVEIPSSPGRPSCRSMYHTNSEFKCVQLRVLATGVIWLLHTRLNQVIFHSPYLASGSQITLFFPTLQPVSSLWTGHCTNPLIICFQDDIVIVNINCIILASFFISFSLFRIFVVQFQSKCA